MVDFKNTILIMTSNLGTREALKEKGFGFMDNESRGESDYRKMSKKMTGIMKDVFPPEFVNRIDEVIVFNHLTIENAYDILDLYLNDVQERLDEKGVTLATSGWNSSYVTFDSKGTYPQLALWGRIGEGTWELQRVYVKGEREGRP